MKSIWMVLVVFVSAVAANAFPLFGHSAAPNGPTEVTGCTDFSGTFHGVCEMKGSRVDETFTLKQTGCEVINTGSLDIPIGSLFSFNAVLPAAAGKPATVLAKNGKLLWSEDRKSLQLDGTLSADDMSATRSVASAKLSGSMRLDGTKLIFTMTDDKGTITCSYDRQ